jgi:hypothetical protein
VSPAFLHAEPALIAALEGRVITRDSAIAALTAKARRFISIPFGLPNRNQSWPTPPTFVTGDQSVFHTAKHPNSVLFLKSLVNGEQERLSYKERPVGNTAGLFSSINKFTVSLKK